MVDRDIREELEKVRIILLKKHPFFGYLTMKCELIEDKNRPTLWADFKRIYYNPDYVLLLTFKQRLWAIMHEVTHNILKHFTRGRKLPIWEKWLIASDFEANMFVAEAIQSVECPKGQGPKAGPEYWKEYFNPHWFLNPAWNNHTGEEIYDLIPDPKPSPTGTCSQQEGDQSGSEDGKGNSAKDQAEWEATIMQAAEFAKAQGKLPHNIESIIARIRNPLIDWRKQIRYYMSIAARDDFSWQRLNKKYLSQGISIPGLYSERAQIVCGVDTSGSVPDTDIAKALGETYGIAKSLGLGFHVLTCDAEIQDDFVIKSLADIDRIKVRGRGGTSFIPVFDHIRKLKGVKPKLLIYFTDLYGSFPNQQSIPTIWVDMLNGQEKPPFGKVIRYPAHSAEKVKK